MSNLPPLWPTFDDFDDDWEFPPIPALPTGNIAVEDIQIGSWHDFVVTSLQEVGSSSGAHLPPSIGEGSSQVGGSGVGEPVGPAVVEFCARNIDAIHRLIQSIQDLPEAHDEADNGNATGVILQLNHYLENLGVSVSFHNLRMLLRAFKWRVPDLVTAYTSTRFDGVEDPAIQAERVLWNQFWNHVLQSEQPAVGQIQPHFHVQAEAVNHPQPDVNIFPNEQAAVGQLQPPFHAHPGAMNHPHPPVFNVDQPPDDQPLVDYIRQLQFEGGLDFSLLSPAEVRLLLTQQGDLDRVLFILGIRLYGINSYRFDTFQFYYDNDQDHFTDRESYAVIRGVARQANKPEIDWDLVMQTDLPGTFRSRRSVRERFSLMVRTPEGRPACMIKQFLFRVAKNLHR